MTWHARLISRRVLERLAKRATQLIACRWGERFPFYYVSEYPKSGGTWLASMIADYLQIPFPQHSVLPIGCTAVIMNHWSYDPRLRRVVYIYRDGRDAITSFLYHRLRVANDPVHFGHRSSRRHLAAIFPDGYQGKEVAGLLPRFIDSEFSRPALGSSMSWAQHVDDWYRPEDRPHVTYVGFEDLLRDTPGTLARVLEQVTGRPSDLDRVVATTRKFSMRAQTGRSPGESDPSHHIRKGIAGDWRSCFTRESAEVFQRHAGDALVRLGYEADAGWIERSFGGAARASE